MPRFRQKLRFVPFSQGRPVWVDDPHFNLRYHVRATALPPPGSEEQLKNLASRVFAQQLDRTKPLWEIWLVEGLGRTNGASPPSENGEGQLDDAPPRFALLTKTHHALVDGVAGVDITAVLFDTAPEPETPPGAGSTWVPRPEPTSMQLLGDALIERAIQPAEIVRSARVGLPRAAAAGLEGHRQPRGRGRAGAHRPRRSAHPAERGDRPAPAVRLGAHGPERDQGDQERARRHGQRRRRGGRDGRAARVPEAARRAGRRAHA